MSESEQPAQEQQEITEQLCWFANGQKGRYKARYNGLIISISPTLYAAQLDVYLSREGIDRGQQEKLYTKVMMEERRLQQAVADFKEDLERWIYYKLNHPYSNAVDVELYHEAR